MSTKVSSPTYRIALTLEELQHILQLVQEYHTSMPALENKLKLATYKAQEGLRKPDYQQTGPREKQYSADKLGLLDDEEEARLMAELEQITPAAPQQQ